MRQIFLFTLALSCLGTASAMKITVRSLPVYDIGGKLENIAFVVNFRDENGLPIKDVPCECGITGPWGRNGWSQKRPIRSGMLFLSGPDRYVPGWYSFSGRVNGKLVSQVINAPLVKERITVQKGYVAAWRDTEDGITSLWVRPSFKSWKDNFVLGWLYFEDDKLDRYKGYWRGRGGMLEFNLPKEMQKSRMWSEFFVFNVPDIYAPQNEPMQPLMALKLSTRYMEQPSLKLKQWWDVTDLYQGE